MSNTETQNLSREKIQQILASIGSQKVEGNDKVEAAEYNWHQPHCFSSKQLKKLDNFTEKGERLSLWSQSGCAIFETALAGQSSPI